MDSKVFDKMVYNDLKGCPKTLKFLEDKAEEIFQIELTKWKDQHSKEEFEDSENWIDFYRSSEKKFEKYILQWLIDTSWKISIRPINEEVSASLIKIFDHCIDLMIENVNVEDLACEIVEKIFNDFEKSEK